MDRGTDRQADRKDKQTDRQTDPTTVALNSGVGTTGAPGAGAPLYFLLDGFCSITCLSRCKRETLGRSDGRYVFARSRR